MRMASFRSNGIALVQVLLLTAIVSMLLLLMIAYARQHIAQAELVDNQWQQSLQVHSASSRLKFALLTQHWLQSHDDQSATQDRLAAHWNFWGEPFEVDDITYSIINRQSLVNPSHDQDRLAHLLTLHGVAQQKSRNLAAEAIRWRQPASSRQPSLRQANQPPGLPFQHLQELALVPGWWPLYLDGILQQIKPAMTLLSTTAQNPYLSPDGLLELVVSPVHSDILRSHRKDGTYSESLFSRVTGVYPDEALVFAPGNTFRVTVSVPASGFHTKRTQEFRVRPEHAVPIVVFREN